MEVPLEFRIFKDTAPRLYANVVILIEGTAITGAYMPELRNNYIVPMLDHFSLQGLRCEFDDLCPVAHARCIYVIVRYGTTQNLPGPYVTVFGPYARPHTVLQVIDDME